MAIVKSNSITVVQTGPIVPLTLNQVDGRLRAGQESYAVPSTGNGTAVNDVILMLAVPSSAILKELKLANDTGMDSNVSPLLTLDVGLYAANAFTDPNSGSPVNYAQNGVISAACYASALTTFQSANASGVDIRTSALTQDKIGQAIWQDAGLSVDPNMKLILGIKIHAAAATKVASKISLRATWIMPN